GGRRGGRARRERNRRERGARRVSYMYRKSPRSPRSLRLLVSRASHYEMPPMQRYLISRNSSMPYFDPSRPRPDSLTPPNGATSAEITPVLTPTMPYSSASATRQMRPMSRP